MRTRDIRSALGLALLVLCTPLGCEEEPCSLTCWDQCFPIENGGCWCCGGCVCHGYPPCNLPEGVSTHYTCSTAHFLRPGENTIYSTGYCNSNSYWYTGRILRKLVEIDYPWPPEDTRPEERTVAIGFEVDGRFIPLDTSAIAGIDWDTGTMVSVHVLAVDDRGFPASATIPDRYELVEVCDVR